jgi:multiple sugar transport system substrate-binding protein
MVSGDPAEKAAYESLVKAFEQKQPIDVKLLHIPSQSDYRTRLAADFAAGTPPDLMLLNYRRISAFAAKGALEPLGTYLGQSTVIDQTEFFPQAVAPFYYRGQLMCIPQNVSSLVVYYNKALFDQAGVAYPKGDWTWQQFVETAQALTKDTNGDGQVDQYGVGIEPSLIRLAPFVWQNGGDLVFNPDAPTRLALDKPEALEAVQWFVDLQLKHHVVPDALQEQAEDSESRFLNGRTAMFFDSRRAVPTFREIKTFDWDVAPLPQGKQRAGILHADGYCMAAKTQNKAAAWTFIEFANSVEGQTLIAATGRTVPSLKAVAESSAFLEPNAKPQNSRVFVDVIPFLRSVPVTDNWEEIEEVVSNELERAFYGQTTVEEAMATAHTRTIEFLKLSIDLQPTTVPGSAAASAPAGSKVQTGCLTIDKPVALAPGFPKDIPFIDDTKFVQSYDYAKLGKHYLLAVAPLPLEEALAFYKERAAQAGYSIKPGDAEPGEYDVLLENAAATTNLRLGSPQSCPTMTVLEFSVRMKS